MTSRIEEFRDRMRTIFNTYLDQQRTAGAVLKQELLTVNEVFGIDINADKDIYTAVTKGLHAEFERKIGEVMR